MFTADLNLQSTLETKMFSQLNVLFSYFIEMFLSCQVYVFQPNNFGFVNSQQGTVLLVTQLDFDQFAFDLLAWGMQKCHLFIYPSIHYLITAA